MVSNDKKEYATIKRKKSKKEEEWRSTKKVGSLLGDEEDINRRKQLATASMNKINAIYLKKDKVKLEKKIKIYRALVKSVLLYSCGTWGVSANVQQRLDAYHRRQLHRILRIKYPTCISNEKLYKVRGEKPISYTMREQRWELFGHILRRDRNIPAFKAMELYFTNIKAKGLRGKPRTTLPKVLSEDLNAYYNKDPIKAEHNYCHRLKLNTKEDLKN